MHTYIHTVRVERERERERERKSSAISLRNAVRPEAFRLIPEDVGIGASPEAADRPGSETWLVANG